MAVYPCAGPNCQRLISVSNIPGGNPAALADPEGFAIQYLKCQACHKYFCDRSLIQLGLSMSATRCPSCQGALVNPNAAPAPMIVASAGSARRIGVSNITVVVTGSTVIMPRLCCCCGGSADSEQPITSSYQSGNRIYRGTWKLPYCAGCAKHVRLLEIGVWQQLQFILTLGLGYLIYLATTKPLKTFWARKFYCNPNCSRLEAPGYRYGPNTHTFTFGSDTFANAMLAANPGNARIG